MRGCLLRCFGSSADELALLRSQPVLQFPFLRTVSVTVGLIAPGVQAIEAQVAAVPNPKLHS